jgi:pimeloyl-ACP methyl ester carboxylesterase
MPTRLSAPTFLAVGKPPRQIATLVDPGKGGQAPGFMWLQGLKSDMVSTKATALAEWGASHGYPVTRFDYSGHGRSGGRFEDGTIGAWVTEAEAVFEQLTSGPQVLVGSSTGAYIALLMLRDYLVRAPELAARMKALVLIAPAWDLTEKLMWDQFPESARRAIMEQGVYMRPSAYGDGAYAITRTFIEEGRQHLIGPAGFDPGRPVIVLQGLLDEDVPWEHAIDLEATLKGDHVRVHMVPEGDHRLSQPADLDLLRAVLADMAALP